MSEIVAFLQTVNPRLATELTRERLAYMKEILNLRAEITTIRETLKAELKLSGELTEKASTLADGVLEATREIDRLKEKVAEFIDGENEGPVIGGSPKHPTIEIPPLSELEEKALDEKVRASLQGYHPDTHEVSAKETEQILGDALARAQARCEDPARHSTDDDDEQYEKDMQFERNEDPA